MSEQLRSVHARFTAEQWAEIAQEAIRRGQLSLGKTVVSLASERLSQLQKAAGSNPEGETT